MARRNLTIQLDDDVIARARVVAARRGTSISGLVASQLVALVEDDARYEEARVQALSSLDSASPRGGRDWNREHLYDRPVPKRG